MQIKGAKIWNHYYLRHVKPWFIASLSAEVLHLHYIDLSPHGESTCSIREARVSSKLHVKNKKNGDSIPYTQLKSSFNNFISIKNVKSCFDFKIITQFSFKFCVYNCV